jgi:hypothetical protein
MASLKPDTSTLNGPEGPCRRHKVRVWYFLDQRQQMRLTCLYGANIWGGSIEVKSQVGRGLNNCRWEKHGFRDHQRKRILGKGRGRP